MKKVFINAWAAENLGDDLLLKVISNRYNNNMYCLSNKKYPKYNNLKFINNNSFIFRINRKLNKLLLKNKIDYRFYFQRKCDVMVSIGGSIFIENPNLEVNEEYLSIYSNCTKPYYIMGCNIGPYKNLEYINLLKDIFKKAEDVCFRDKKSYDLVSSLTNVRYAQDIVFNLDVSKYHKIEKQKVIISVIDCNEKKSQIGFECQELYESKIVEIINYYEKLNYEIELMSFCKIEGDERAIQSILKKTNFKNKIKVYKYDGNIDSALNEIASCEIIIGTRFHANILGILFDKKILPIAYNNKTINTMKDLEFNGIVLSMNDLKNFSVEEQLCKIKKSNLNISKIKENSEKQFRELDKILIKRK